MMYPFVAAAIKGMRPNGIPARSTANDLAELLRRMTKNVFQGGNFRKGSKATLSLASRSIFPGIEAKNPRRNAAMKRAARDMTYRAMFRSEISYPA